MEKDLIYIFDKTTQKREEIGEISTGFNMSFVIDGTKDSTKVELWSYRETEIEPFTICWHKKTNTWWIVANDKIDRYLNESGTFVYIHNINLLGAIELLNARDLTDCGFNQRRYTTQEFLKRLVEMSNFEHKGSFLSIVSLVGQDFLSQKVDFIKSYENYSLLSAIRDFLDSYNMCAKLSFNTMETGGNTYIQSAVITIYSKTGNQNLTTHNISEFDDVRETKTMSKESFGTCVVSNAENVISSTPKTFPSIGGIQMSSTDYEIENGNSLNNGVIRLPSNVYKGNWIKIFHPTKINLSIQGQVTHNFEYEYTGTQASFIRLRAKFLADIISDTGDPAVASEFNGLMNEEMYNNLNLTTSTTVYSAVDVNPSNGGLIKDKNAPTLALFEFSGTLKNVAFVDSKLKACLPEKRQGIQWERGSNIISGFEMLSGNGVTSTWSTDYRGDATLISFVKNGITVTMSIVFPIVLKDIHTGGTGLAKQLKKLSFAINYIPMSDIKVKVDNQRTKRDIHLYNQNGKLTDNFALSKMINSYSKEISSDTITRYIQYYDFSSVPQVGAFVNVNGENYVINNVSCDFTQTEESNTEFGYLIECEITMSKYVATKSLMVNPNTNIRDYGIPQQYNVKRKQLYRDYYELGYSLNSDNERTYYIDPSKIFNFGTNPNEQINLTAVIRCDYKEPVGGDTNDNTNASIVWYYQLETTTYYMNKMVYVMLDFNDNNIIGYANQNVYSGFKVERIFDGSIDNINTPISYVDKDGEVKHINIKLCNIQQLTTRYSEYQSSQTGGDTYEGSLYNYSCFIPSEIYEYMNDYTMLISEQYYNKDAIEVPVFEYACQIDDSNEVLIGDNILAQHDNCIYFYHFVYGQNLTQDNVFDNSNVSVLESPNRLRMTDSATIEYQSESLTRKILKVKLWQNTTYNLDNNTWSNINQRAIAPNTDLAIFRHSYNLATNEEIVELLFIAKNVPQGSISSDTLTLVLNHYKLN